VRARLLISRPVASTRPEGLSSVTSLEVRAMPSSGSTSSLSVVSRAASPRASASRTTTTLPSIHTRWPPCSRRPWSAVAVIGGWRGSKDCSFTDSSSAESSSG
jgi:hypothetical protein